MIGSSPYPITSKWKPSQALFYNNNIRSRFNYSYRLLFADKINSINFNKKINYGKRRVFKRERNT